jgi:hypothetical protein
MSPLTLFIAKLVGLMFLVFSLLMAMNKRAMLAAIDELVRSRGLMLSPVRSTLLLDWRSFSAITAGAAAR